MSATIHFSEPQDSQEHTSKPLDEAVCRLACVVEEESPRRKTACSRPHQSGELGLYRCADGGYVGVLVRLNVLCFYISGHSESCHRTWRDRHDIRDPSYAAIHLRRLIRRDRRTL